MQIKIWIRASADNPRKVELRTDKKFESRDTPTICTFGNKLVEVENKGKGEG